MTQLIADFGQKIGGAKKDYYSRGITLAILAEMDDIDRKNYLVKDNIWPRPNYKKMKGSSSLEQIYYLKTIYDAIPTTNLANPEEFVEFVNAVRSIFSDVTTISREQFKDNLEKGAYHRSLKNAPEIVNSSISRRKLFTAAKSSFRRLYNSVCSKEYLMGKKEAIRYGAEFTQVDGERLKLTNWHGVDYVYRSGDGRYILKTSDDIDDVHEGSWVVLSDKCPNLFPSNSREETERLFDNYVDNLEEQSIVPRQRKVKFVPSLLGEIVRSEPDYLNGQNATGQMFIDTFGIRGGEFGNWLNDDERQNVLNYGYEAFKDLAKALNIADKSISLGGELSIAFGARGSGSALAHYEPDRKVINLTKMKGAGALAHEWGHALDDYARRFRELRIFRRRIIDAMQTAPKTVGADASRVEKVVDQWFDRCFLPLKYHEFEQLNEKDQAAIMNRFRQELVKACAPEYRKDLETESHDMSDGESIPHFLDPFNEWLKPFGLSLWGIEMRSIARNCCSMNVLANPVVESNYYKTSEQFDKRYAKCDKGYWASQEEMWARAFACYVHDKLTRSDYLCGLAYCGQPVPDENEKKRIYPLFDEFIEMCKNIGAL